jgi:hypothetical protein
MMSHFKQAARASPNATVENLKGKIMLKIQHLEIGRGLSMTALGLGIVGIPLWMLSYVWILFRYAGRETEAVWDVVIAGEIGAMLAVLLGTISGVMARRYVEPDDKDFRCATSGLKLCAAVFICIVLFNVMGIIFFS